ncbi:MAG: carboxypeptidase regulatory-like domain-containing protein [Acidobacteriota bacterium]
MSRFLSVCEAVFTVVVFDGQPSRGRLLKHACVALMLVVMVGGSVLRAQEIRGTLLGRVVDSSGASVPEAKVTVTNEATKTSAELTTNLVGSYVAPFLTPGVYAISVSHEGFNTVSRSDIVLQTQGRLTVDFTLTPGGLAETVMVTAEPPMLQTTSADFGQVLDSKLLNRLPIVGDNPLATADIAPGVIPQVVGTATNYETSFVRINGSSATGNQMNIDGAAADVPRMSGVSYVWPMSEMVEELKVVTAMFDASQGRTNGGAIMVSTKTGTNQFHGSAYLNVRDERLNANTWTNNYFGQPRGLVNQLILGGVVNGPIIKDRTFFSVGLERQRSTRSVSYQWRVPTDLERQGDFSQTLSPSGQPLQLYDPLTTVMDANGKFVSRQQFDGARISASRINPVGAAVMSQYPKANYFANPNQLGLPNYLGSVVLDLPYTYLQSRVDHNLNDKHRLYGRFARNYAVFNDFDFSNPPLPGYLGFTPQARSAHQFVVDDTVTFRSTLVASFRVGFNRFSQHVRGVGDNLDPDILKLPDIIKNNLYSGGDQPAGWPRFDVNDGAIPPIGPGFRKNVNNVLSAAAAFNSYWSNHNLRWGAEYRNTRWNDNFPGNAQNGAFTFDKLLTRANDNANSNTTSGSGMASLLLGLPTGGSMVRAAAPAAQSHYAALYIQDDYRIRPSLSLALGLRYELETPFTERFDRMWYDFSSDENLGITVPGIGELKGGLRFVNTNGLPRRQGTMDRDNFGPRIGVSYMMGSKTVIRAAWGLVYEGLVNNLNSGGPVVPGSYSFNTAYIGSGDGYRTVLPGVSLSNPFPNGFNPITGNALGNQSLLGSGITYTNPNIKLPSIHQFQLTVQRQLPWSSMAEIAYVGVRYNSLFRDYNLNEVPDAFRTEDNTTTNPFYGILPASTSRGASAKITANQLKVRFPQFTSVTEQNVNGPWGRYHSMQTRWEKRLSDGVQVVANYTFSKNMEFDPQSLVNDRFYKTVTASDRTHLARIFATADLPLGKNKRIGATWPRWLDHVVGGWSLTWIFKYATGAPLGLIGPIGRPIPIGNPSTDRDVHDCLGTPATGLPATPCLDINKVQALTGKYDITPEPERYDWLRAPNRISHDAVFFKTFHLYDRLAFDLRAEVINVPNSPLWGDPGTNISNPKTFGQITSGENPRTVRFTGRLSF